MQPTDDRGVLLNYDRSAPKCDTTGILQELIGNRRHGSIGKNGTQFLIATFKDKNIPYLIIGSSQPRKREDVNHELTPFKSNPRTIGEPTRLREKGYGAKLVLFHFRGCFSIMYQTAESETFNSNESDWMMTRETDIDELSKNLDSNYPFDVGPYAPLHCSATHPRYGNPFWRIPDVVESELMQHIKQSSYRSFYMFSNYSVKRDLDVHIERVVRIYEGTDVQIFRSNDMKTPYQVVVNPNISLGLLPTYWENSINVYCKIGTKLEEFMDSKFLIQFPNEPMRLKLVKNGLTEDKDPNSKWTIENADIMITISKLSNGYLEKADLRKSVGMVDSDLSRQVFLSLEGDTLSDKPIADDSVGTSIRTALLKYAGTSRIVVKILKENVKDNSNTGLHIEPFKRDTKLQEKMGIHECIKRACLIFRRCCDTTFDEESIRNAADSIARHRDASKKRSNEGKKYEQVLGEDIQRSFDTIRWTVGDAIIQSKYNLNGQGIDVLGVWGGTEESPKYAIAIQIKDVSTLNTEQVKKFTDTVREFNNTFTNIYTFPFLVWKSPKDSISTTVYNEIDNIGGRIVFESMGVCDRIRREINGCENDS